MSFWPIYLTINELPFDIRKKRENILLAGLWYGNTKPDTNRFFHSIRADLEKLAKGIRVQLPNHDRSICVKGVLLIPQQDVNA